MSQLSSEISQKPNQLSNRGLRPLADLAQHRQHGERLRYMAGCRCTECRRANTNYEKVRAVARKAGDWNGIVPADRARAHMASLSAINVGRRAVGDVTGVADTVLCGVIAGRKTHIRARTERLILAVTEAAAADRALIPAAPTWKLLDELIQDGYTRAALARQLGYANPALQLNRNQITVRNAYDVQRLYEQLRTIDAAPTLRLIDQLKDEGFRMLQIQIRLATLAQELNAPVPDLTVRRGRIRADVAQLVRRLHQLMTE